MTANPSPSKGMAWGESMSMLFQRQMRFHAQASPCKDCQKRWVSDKGRCHDSCPEYKEFRQKIETAENRRREKNRREADFFGVIETKNPNKPKER